MVGRWTEESSFRLVSLGLLTDGLSVGLQLFQELMVAVVILVLNFIHQEIEWFWPIFGFLKSVAHAGHVPDS